MLKRHIFLCALLLVSFTAYPYCSFANTGVFFGAGQQIFPIKTDSVRLIKENVHIKIAPSSINIKDKLHIGGVPFFPKADVRATFILKNITKKPITLQVGFPFLDLQGFGDENFALEHLKLTVTSNGELKPSILKEGILDKELDPQNLFKKVFTWEESFEPGQTKEVTVTYTLYLGVVSLNSRFRPFDETGKKYHEIDDVLNALGYSFFYITQTAKTWKGPLEKAVFTVDCTGLFKEIDDSMGHLFIKSILEEANEQFKNASPSTQERLNNFQRRSRNISRPLMVEIHQPADFRKSGGIYTWTFTEKIPDNGLDILFAVIYVPSCSEKVLEYIEDVSSTLEYASQEEFRNILTAYYEKILNEETASDQFLRDYFEAVSWLTKGVAPVFETDRQAIKQIIERLRDSSKD